MVMQCSYCGKKADNGRTFHQFPLKNPALLKKWIVAIGKENYTPGEASWLSSKHFERTCFRPSGYGESLRLRNTAVPTIFLPMPSEGVPVFGEKRLHDSLQNSLMKHPRLAIPHATRVVETAEQEMSSFEDEALAGTLKKIPISAVTTTNRTTQPTEPNTRQRLLLVKHDHHYASTPTTTKRKLMLSNKKVKILQQQVRVHKQRINRLKKKIHSLKDIVSELRALKKH